jgi:hypothetical protein
MINPHLSLNIRILDFLDYQKQAGNPEVKAQILIEKYCEAQHVVPGNKINLEHDGAYLVPILERLDKDQLIICKRHEIYPTNIYTITELGEKKLADIKINLT